MKRLLKGLTKLLVMFVFVMFSNAEAASGTAELVIFHTNDLHARVSPKDDNGQSIGLAEISAAIKTTELKNSDTLWFDAGDTLHGTPRINVSKGEHMVNLLNETTLDAMVPGNHDFNYGSERLRELSKNLNVMLLSANTVQANTHKYIFKPYQIYKLPNNIKVGVFGLTTPETSYKSNPNNTVGIDFLNPIEQAQDMVKKLRTKCDVLVAITHMGIDKNSKFTSDMIAKEVQGIDLIIDGHGNDVLPEGMTVGDTLIVRTGWHGHKLGRVTISLNAHKIISKKAELLSKEDVAAIAPNPDNNIKKALTIIDRRNAKLFNAVIANSDRRMSCSSVIVRRQESELGNLTADAFRWKTGADIAAMNGGGLRADLPAGDVRRIDVMSIYPFGNTVQVVEIKGSTIKEMLEHSVAAYPTTFDGFLSVSGMKFSFDPTQPAGERVRDISIGHEALDDNKIYKLATMDFLIDGGDGYDMLKNLDVVTKYGNAEGIVGEYLWKIGIGKINTNRIKLFDANEVSENLQDDTENEAA